MPEPTLPEIERALEACGKAPTAGWRHNASYICVGTLRIARADFDTSPSKARQSEILDYLVASCNGWEACLLELKRRMTPVKPSIYLPEHYSFHVGNCICGRQCRAGSKFCVHCGIPLNWEGK